MAWTNLATASSLQEFSQSVPAYTKELPKGTKLKLRVELSIPVGKIADIAGAEWWSQYFVPRGIDVLDVYGDSWWFEVLAEVDPPLAPATVIAIIAIAVAALPLGIAWLITSIKLDADVLGETVVTGTVAVALLIILALAILAKRRERSGAV